MIAMTRGSTTDHTGDILSFVTDQTQTLVSIVLFKFIVIKQKKNFTLDEDLHHLTTEEHTDLGQDPGPILLVSPSITL